MNLWQTVAAFLSCKRIMRLICFLSIYLFGYFVQELKHAWFEWELSIAYFLKSFSCQFNIISSGYSNDSTSIRFWKWFQPIPLFHYKSESPELKLSFTFKIPCYRNVVIKTQGVCVYVMQDVCDVFASCFNLA